MIAKQIDILVIGGGMAGFSASIAAAQAGARVTMLEKCDAIGGSSLLSGATFAFAGTDMQRDQGVEDSVDVLRADLLDVGGHKNDPAIVEVYLDHQLETYDWLRAVGVNFSAVELSSNMSRPRSHSALPRQIFDVLEAAADKAGVARFTGAAVTGLSPAPEGWTAEVQMKDAVHQVQARAVIIATGGFARSIGLVEKFVPGQSAALRLGGQGSTGDGIEMAMAMGADVADVEYVSSTYGVPLAHYPDRRIETQGPPPLVHAMYRGAIIVNLDAKRFANEASSYKVLGDICLQQPEAVSFQIIDQAILDQSVELPRTHNYKDALKRGFLRKADTIAELAGLVGLDAAALEDTVARYNAFVDSGKDEDFGRVTLGKGYGVPVRIDTAPFYIIPCTASLFSTYGGLKINDSLQVVTASGEPLGNIFAAGEVVGGFHGKGYMSGTGMGKAAVFGRQAGLRAAASITQ